MNDIGALQHSPMVQQYLRAASARRWCRPVSGEITALGPDKLPLDALEI